MKTAGEGNTEMKSFMTKYLLYFSHLSNSDPLTCMSLSSIECENNKLIQNWSYCQKWITCSLKISLKLNMNGIKTYITQL